MVAVLGGCADGADGGAPTRDADLVGVVTEVRDRAILVEEQPAAPAGRKAWVTFGAVPVVTQGAAVQVWLTGGCAESYPEQCGGEAVRTS